VLEIDLGQDRRGADAVAECDQLALDSGGRLESTNLPKICWGQVQQPQRHGAITSHCRLIRIAPGGGEQRSGTQGHASAPELFDE
jgi:hypothetical protein